VDKDSHRQARFIYGQFVPVRAGNHTDEGWRAQHRPAFKEYVLDQ
jgi:hypothetical protein